MCFLSPVFAPDEQLITHDLAFVSIGDREVDLGDGSDRHEREIVRDQLLIWREDWAEKAHVSPTAVLSDRAVEALSIERPCRMDELADIEGIGQSKARRFGLKLLEITCLDE